MGLARAARISQPGECGLAPDTATGGSRGCESPRRYLPYRAPRCSARRLGRAARAARPFSEKSMISCQLPLSGGLSQAFNRGVARPAAGFMARLAIACPSADAQEVVSRAIGGDTAHKNKSDTLMREPDTASAQPRGTTATTACRAEYGDGGGGGGVPLRHPLTPDSRERPATKSQANEPLAILPYCGGGPRSRAGGSSRLGIGRTMPATSEKMDVTSRGGEKPRTLPLSGGPSTCGPSGPSPPQAERLERRMGYPSAAAHFQLTPRTRAAPQRATAGTPFRLCFAQSRAGLSLASCAQLRAFARVTAMEGAHA